MYQSFLGVRYTTRKSGVRVAATASRIAQSLWHVLCCNIWFLCYIRNPWSMIANWFCLILHLFCFVPTGSFYLITRTIVLLCHSLLAMPSSPVQAPSYRNQPPMERLQCRDLLHLLWGSGWLQGTHCQQDLMALWRLRPTLIVRLILAKTQDWRAGLLPQITGPVPPALSQLGHMTARHLPISNGKGRELDKSNRDGGGGGLPADLEWCGCKHTVSSSSVVYYTSYWFDLHCYSQWNLFKLLSPILYMFELNWNSMETRDHKHLWRCPVKKSKVVHISLWLTGQCNN